MARTKYIVNQIDLTNNQNPQNGMPIDINHKGVSFGVNSVSTDAFYIGNYVNGIYLNADSSTGITLNNTNASSMNINLENSGGLTINANNSSGLNYHGGVDGSGGVTFDLISTIPGDGGGFEVYSNGGPIILRLEGTGNGGYILLDSADGITLNDHISGSKIYLGALGSEIDFASTTTPNGVFPTVYMSVNGLGNGQPYTDFSIFNTGYSSTPDGGGNYKMKEANRITMKGYGEGTLNALTLLNYDYTGGISQFISLENVSSGGQIFLNNGSGGELQLCPGNTMLQNTSGALSLSCATNSKLEITGGSYVDITSFGRTRLYATEEVRLGGVVDTTPGGGDVKTPAVNIFSKTQTIDDTDSGYQLGHFDNVLVCDISTDNIEVYLPTIALTSGGVGLESVGVGKEYKLVVSSVDLLSVNTLTINTDGSQLFLSNLTATMSVGISEVGRIISLIAVIDKAGNFAWVGV